MDTIYLILVGFISGAINVIAGGASLLTLPLLIFLGLPPNIANGTNRVAIFFQNFSGAAGYKSKKIDTHPYDIYFGIAALIGAFIGAKLAVDIKGDVFNKILSIVMVFVLFFLILKPKDLEKLAERTSPKYIWINSVIFFIIGIYAGFIQAGTGLFMLLALNRINRFSLLKSNAAKTTIMFIYTISALATFAYYDKINWEYGLTLAFGGVIGAWFASRWAVKKGDKLIRAFLIVTVIGMAIKLWFY